MPGFDLMSILSGLGGDPSATQSIGGVAVPGTKPPLPGTGAGIDFGGALPILQGLLAGQGDGQQLPVGNANVARGGPINPVQLPQSNPASIRNRL